MHLDFISINPSGSIRRLKTQQLSEQDKFNQKELLTSKNGRTHLKDSEIACTEKELWHIGWGNVGNDRIRDDEGSPIPNPRLRLIPLKTMCPPLENPAIGGEETFHIADYVDL